MSKNNMGEDRFLYRPLPYRGNFKVTSPYGYRTLGGKREFHRGLDLVGIDSKEVRCISGGVVVSSTIVTDKTNRTWEWGNYVHVKSDDGYSFFYCHLKTRSVKVGERVEVGDLIGIEGSTGYSLGSHCHVEMRKGAQSMNVAEYMEIDNKAHSIDNAPDYVNAIVNKVGYDDKEQAKKAFRKITHPYLDSLLRKLYEKLI